MSGHHPPLTCAEFQSDELDMWVKASDGFSIAHLKEMIVAVKCFGQPLNAVVKRLEEMQARKPTSERAPDKPSTGFLNGFHQEGQRLG